MSDRGPGEERARRLETAVEGLRRRVECLGAEVLYREPAEGEWSAMAALAHVAEILPYWSRQAREVAARDRDNQPFGRTHEDPDRIAAVEQHAHDRLDEVLPRLAAGLEEAAATLRAIPPEGWARTARHARRGEMTVEQAVDGFLVAHVEEHVQQIEATLRALGSAGA
jgi:uncharacterized damage-inducible protein DinB